MPVTAINPATKLETTVALIAASVPVGFVLYQMYYTTYGPFVLRRNDGVSYVTRDRGADIFGALPPERLAQLRHVFGARLDVRTWYVQDSKRTLFARCFSLLQLDGADLRSAYPRPMDPTPPPTAASGSPSPASSHVEIDPRQLTRIYDDNWRENWGVFRSLLDLAASRAEAKELKTEFTTLSDIYHALGASRLAVLVGGLLGAVYAGALYPERLINHPVREAVSALGLMAAGAALIRLLHHAREGTWRSALACAHYGLCWCFETHPDLMQLDGQTYPLVPRTQLRRPR